MSVYFNKYKGMKENFITIGIKNPDISIVATLTEEEFLEMVEQVKNNPPSYPLPPEDYKEEEYIDKEQDAYFVNITNLILDQYGNYVRKKE